MSEINITDLEKEIAEKQKLLAKLKKALPPSPVHDYELRNTNGVPTKLSALFGESDELLVIHNMGKACTYCTMWADGFRGFTEIISDRMPWVLTSPDEPQILKAFSESRNWDFNVLSHAGTSFAKDLGFADEKNGETIFHPGVSALVKTNGAIFRVGKDTFGPGDKYNPFWHFVDLFPKGVNRWTPKYIY